MKSRVMTQPFKTGLERRSTVTLFLLVLTLFAIAPGHALGATYYVDVSHSKASDSNPGTKDLPWETMYALNTHSLSPGDTVYVMPGVYNVHSGGNWNTPSINPNGSGTPGNPITIKSFIRHQAIIDGGFFASPQSSICQKQHSIGTKGRSHIIWDGFYVRNHCQGAIRVSEGSKFVTIINNVVDTVLMPADHPFPDDNVQGIGLKASEDSLIKWNTIFNVWNNHPTHNSAGIQLYWNDTGGEAVIEHNEIYNTYSGVYDKRGRKSIIRNNFIHDLHPNGEPCKSCTNIDPGGTIPPPPENGSISTPAPPTNLTVK